MRGLTETATSFHPLALLFGADYSARGLMSVIMWSYPFMASVVMNDLQNRDWESGFEQEFNQSFIVSQTPLSFHPAGKLQVILAAQCSSIASRSWLKTKEGRSILVLIYLKTGSQGLVKGFVYFYKTAIILLNWNTSINQIS